MGTGHRTAAAKQGRARAAPKLSAGTAIIEPDLGQGDRARTAARSLAHDQVAGRYERAAVLALCARSRSCRRIAITIARRPNRRVAADRMAEGRGRADQILALDASARHRVPTIWSTWPNCAGSLSATTRNSNRNSGSGIIEGRGWRGFHHHATLCIAAYGFLISERETIPPSGPATAAFFPQLAVPDGYRPRGSAIAA